MGTKEILLVLFGMALLNFIQQSIKLYNLSKTKKNKTTHFEVDLGRGKETLTYEQMQNLSEEDIKYLFKNAKGCTSFEVDNGDWDVESLQNYSKMFSNLEVKK